jgi:hypothetical protein
MIFSALDANSVNMLKVVYRIRKIRQKYLIVFQSSKNTPEVFKRTRRTQRLRLVVFYVRSCLRIRQKYFNLHEEYD